MLIDYWVAGHLGAVWLRLKPGRRKEPNDLPLLCLEVARGANVHARTLWRVQDFAVDVWQRLIYVAFAVLLIVGLPWKLLSGGAVPFAAAVSFGSILVLVIGIAGAQMITIGYRSNRNKLYLRKAGWEAPVQPLPPGSPGLPRRSDFWVAFVPAVVITAILAYAGFHNAPH
jgi:hypothetical protein